MMEEVKAMIVWRREKFLHSYEPGNGSTFIWAAALSHRHGEECVQVGMDEEETPPVTAGVQ